MSIKAMSRVWDQSKATGNELIVLLAIADHADDDGCNAYPGLQTLARKARIGERETRYCLRKLEELGELRVTLQQRANGSYRSSLYEILIGGVGHIMPHDSGAGACPSRVQVCAPPLEPSLEEEKESKEKEPLAVPQELNTPEFISAWNDYVSYRKQAKFKPLFPTSVQAQFKRLSPFGSPHATEAVRVTIANGWQGIFPEKVNGNHKPNGYHQPGERRLSL